MQPFTYDGLSTEDDSRDDGPSRRVRWRLGICAAAFFLGLMLAAMPIPYVSQVSLTQVIFEIVGRSSPFSCRFGGCGDGVGLYFYVSALSAFFLMQPVLIYQGLALAGPPVLGNRRPARALATASLYLAFLLGVVIATRLLVPRMLARMYRSDPLDLIQMFPYGVHMWTTPSLYFVTGFAFQLALLPTVLIRLRIARYSALAHSRRYMLLAAVIIAALVTPTSDLVTLAMIAVPLYLLYELGLLIARFAAPSLRPRDV